MDSEDREFFFSYARADSEFALELATCLRNAGLSLWIDQLDLLGGQRWDEAIHRALQNCQGMIVVLSPESVASHNVLDEVAYAIEEGKRLVPVLLRRCDIPFRLRRFQYVDLTADFDGGIRDLAKTLAVNRPIKLVNRGAVSRPAKSTEEPPRPLTREPPRRFIQESPKQLTQESPKTLKQEPSKTPTESSFKPEIQLQAQAERRVTERDSESHQIGRTDPLTEPHNRKVSKPDGLRRRLHPAFRATAAVVVFALGFWFFLPSEAPPPLVRVDSIERATKMHEDGSTENAISILERIQPEDPSYEAAQTLITRWKTAISAEAWTRLQKVKDTLDAKRRELRLLRDENSRDEGGNNRAVSGRLSTLEGEVAKLTEEFQGQVIDFINSQDLYEGQELTEAQQAAFDMKAQEDILVAQEYIDKAGNYQKAIDIFTTSLLTDPDSELLREAKARAEELRYMTEERFAAVKKGMSEAEVRDALGTPQPMNVREYEDRGVTAWFYPRTERKAAAGIFFRRRGGELEVYAADFGAIEPEE